MKVAYHRRVCQRPIHADAKPKSKFDNAEGLRYNNMQVIAYCFRKRTVLLLVEFRDIKIIYWSSGPVSEPRIIFLADSRGLDNHNAARHRNG